LEHAPAGAAALRLLDLGTGSGCLLLALLSELPSARGLGTDISHAALMTAQVNANRLGLAERAAFLQASWCEAIGPGWDIIVSNPPYIAEAVISALDPEVRCHDPQAALDGGADGLAAYRALLPGAVRCLAPGGLLALEVGAGQAGAVSALLAGQGFGQIDGKRDLAGVVRCLLARR
jgi:release factor glutamine methyltransferase